ncbi:olfactory receptor 14I1-like, partial [Gallus gallus]|uniref:olfactory receptor 14I1-like n=1 Tax=Gallus gallus TaxID=9031 RepID=UPI001AE32693
LGIYLAALLGNGLISTAVACDHRLHTPMYFFLLNLALLDLGCISTTLPKAMANALWHTRHISYTGCAAQVFFFVFFLSAEYCLLTMMSYDRYVAICKPLHYGTYIFLQALLVFHMPGHIELQFDSNIPKFISAADTRVEKAQNAVKSLTP